MVRSSSVLSILTWKCASRHNGVHFFMSHLASWLRTRRFSEPTFRPSGATNHWKNTVNRDFPIFSRIYLFFLLIFSLLSASSLLCVSTVHIVGSLASKLPSIIFPFLVNSRIMFLSCFLQQGFFLGPLSSCFGSPKPKKCRNAFGFGGSLVPSSRKIT